MQVFSYYVAVECLFAVPLVSFVSNVTALGAEVFLVESLECEMLRTQHIGIGCHLKCCSKMCKILHSICIATNTSVLLRVYSLPWDHVYRVVA
jgi:hypothetical protein